ncbi:MAG: hypothetical protein KKF56_00015 [Nanoarchaeota archaeon]|nr:hypothetical protein [Nanoarchaeota archaeon]
MIKKKILGIGMVLLVVMMSSFVMAGEPFNLCWNKGQTVEWSLCDDDYSDLTCTGYMCNSCAHYRDGDGVLCPANPNYCNQQSSDCVWFGGPRDETVPNIYLTKPQDGGFYQVDKVDVEIDSNEVVYWYYKVHDSVDEKWVKICGKTTHCVKSIYLEEGDNAVEFKATDETGNSNYTDIVYFVIDSKAPSIKKFLPTKGFANGEFYVEFDEGSAVEMKMFIQNIGEIVAAAVPEEVILDLSLCEMGKRYMECNFNVNLGGYDPGEVEVWVTLEDIVGSIAESKHNKLDVDMSAPRILTPVGEIIEEIDGKYVYFNFEVEETNLDEVGYTYMDGDKLKTKKLCTKLNDENRCIKKVSFKDGEHEITIYVEDEAGSGLAEPVVLNFFSDSKKPKIKKITPKSGLTNGEFYVEIQEENPVELIFKYRTTGFLGFIGNGDTHEEIVDLDNDCVFIKGKSDKRGCVVDINAELIALGYDEEEIEVWAYLKDRADQEVESKKYDLDVDISPPVIMNPGAWFRVEGNYAYFEIQITEENFDEVLYLDYKGNYRRLCSRLDDGLCEKKKGLRYLPEGQVEILVLDDAGNFVEGFFDV